jgi:hypothetical protein
VIARWPCPGPGGPHDELAIAFDRSRARRLLVVPALFEEANRTRRFLVETMRRLDQAGIDSFLPDLPGCNESLQPFAEQSLATWREAMIAAQRHFAATEVLSLRGGTLVAPERSPGWQLEPVAGKSLLRQLLRARSIAAREAGREERLETLLEEGRISGLELAGYPCSAMLITGLEEATPAATEALLQVKQTQLGGGAQWLRSEPSEDAAQSDALSALIAAGARH